MADPFKMIKNVAGTGARFAADTTKKAVDALASTANRVQTQQAVATKLTQPKKVFKQVRKDLLRDMRQAYAVNDMNAQRFSELAAQAQIRLLSEVNEALRVMPGEFRTGKFTAQMTFDVAVLKGITLVDIDKVHYVDIADQVDERNFFQEGVKAVGVSAVVGQATKVVTRLGKSKKVVGAAKTAKTASKGGGIAGLAVGFAMERAVTAGVKKADEYFDQQQRVNKLYTASNLKKVFDLAEETLSGQLEAFKQSLRVDDVVFELPETISAMNDDHEF